MTGDKHAADSFPVLEETAYIKRVVRETDRILINTSVQERTEFVDIDLSSGEAVIERVAINLFVDEAPPIRQEGDLIIVPLLEEVLVTEKKLLLREEVHIRRTVTVEHVHEPVVLRSEEVSFERPTATEHVMEDKL
ncbi:MAG: YsnF/AvaK domain-containing protein [Alphaproteobacteria bacterium]|nr:YsnF/AvaK domain-containing protein [Alphaproteobacteria bacterium]